MNDTRVAPALTAEEWEKRELREYNFRVFWVEDDDACLDSSADEYGPARVPLVKVAALALADKTFGFTREDVRELRYAASRVDPGQITSLHSLADRIESLLPPEP